MALKPVDSDTFMLYYLDFFEWSINADACAVPTDEEREHGAEGTRYFVDDDHRSGFAIRADGELVFLHSQDSGQGNFLVAEAIRNGATHLDCFDGYLPTLYKRHGFVEARREANWTPGGPDVVYMEQCAHCCEDSDGHCAHCGVK